MPKPNLLLLDADVVIEAHKLGVWGALKKSFSIAVPATIVREARYFKSAKGSGGIDLQKEIDAGEVICIEATAEEIANTFQNFDSVFMQGIDDGEKEGIAIIRTGKAPDCLFCTGDTNAIEAIGMLAIEHSSVSFEGALQTARLSVPRVRRSMTTSAHRDHVEKGKTRRITGECFKVSPLGL